MLRIALCFVVALLTSACGGPRYVDFFPYHDDGTVKPRVVMLPVMDASAVHLPWDLAKEMNSGIRYELMNEGILFVASPSEMQEGLTKLGKVNFFLDEPLLARTFCNEDFVVLVEIIEHDYQTYGCADDPVTPNAYASCQARLTVKMRVRIIDVRSGCPRVVLQEVITDWDLVPRICADLNIEEADKYANWMKSVKKAHCRLIYNISRRMESVIKSAF